MAAALVLGAAVLVRPAAAFSCAAEPPPLAIRVQESDLIVLGTVTSVAAEEARITPAAYLKGPAQAGDLVLKAPPASECPLATLAAGTRVLALVSSVNGTLQWPDAHYLYVLSSGNAATGGPSPDTVTEADLLQQVRSLTNQYAVPATTGDDGASLDWVKTVVPVTLALLVVFGIGLYLMRIWHRIDPS